jgi:hypothetical protein
MFWAMSIIQHRRWETGDDNPPWWGGALRISFRVLFSLLVFIFGLVGTICHDEDLRVSIKMNEAVAVIVWIDILRGVVDYRFFLTFPYSSSGAV